MLIERQKNNNCSLVVEETLPDGKVLKHNIEFSAYKGNPRFTLWRDYEKDESLSEEAKKALLIKNTTNVTFTLKYFETFMHFAQQLPKNQNPVINYTHTAKNIKFVNGERTNELYEQGELTIGRDEEGLYYMEIGEKDKSTVRYRFVDEKFFINKVNGKPINTPKAKSLIFYKSYFATAHSLAKSYINLHLLNEAMKDMHKAKK